MFDLNESMSIAVLFYLTVRYVDGFNDSRIYSRMWFQNLWSILFLDLQIPEDDDKNSQESLVKCETQNRWCFVGQRVHVGNPGCHKQLVVYHDWGWFMPPFIVMTWGLFFNCVNHFKIFCYLLVLLLGKRDRWRDLKRLTPREVTHEDPNLGQT